MNPLKSKPRVGKFKICMLKSHVKEESTLVTLKLIDKTLLEDMKDE